MLPRQRYSGCSTMLSIIYHHIFLKNLLSIGSIFSKCPGNIEPFHHSLVWQVYPGGRGKQKSASSSSVAASPSSIQYCGHFASFLRRIVCIQGQIKKKMKNNYSDVVFISRQKQSEKLNFEQNKKFFSDIT